jgi:hypothetical protein
MGLTNLGSESETCVGNRVHLVGVAISFEKNFYRLPFTPPLSGSQYRSFTYSTCGMLTYKTRGDTQLITRREDGIRGMDHSINPRNSRDAAQHTYKIRGSSSLVVRKSKSNMK